MKEHGYEGIFNPKSRAKHMGEDERQHVDGCAIFWKSAKYVDKVNVFINLLIILSLSDEVVFGYLFTFEFSLR